MGLGRALSVVSEPVKSGHRTLALALIIIKPIVTVTMLQLGSQKHLAHPDFKLT